MILFANAYFISSLCVLFIELHKKLILVYKWSILLCCKWKKKFMIHVLVFMCRVMASGQRYLDLEVLGLWRMWLDVCGAMECLHYNCKKLTTMEDDSTKKRKERNAREKGWVIGEGMHIFHWFVYIVLSSFTHFVKLYKYMCFLCVFDLHLPFLPWDEISLHSFKIYISLNNISKTIYTHNVNNNFKYFVSR